MSRRYDIEFSLVYWLSKHNIPYTEDIDDFVLEVLSSAGQVEIDIDNEDYFAGERERVHETVKAIYEQCAG